MKYLNFVYLFIFVLACDASENEENYTITKIDEMTMIENFRQSRINNLITLEFVKKIGGLDETDENFQLFQPFDVSVDGKGFIYVLDRGNFRIQKYNNLGQYVQTIGRKGEGPGEFSAPYSIKIFGDSVLAAYDIQNTILFNLDGAEVRRLNANNNEYYRYLPFTDEKYIVDRVQYPQSGVNSRGLILVLNEQGEVLYTFCEPTDFGDEALNRKFNTIKYNIDHNNNIYVAFFYQNRVDKYNEDGKLLWRFTRKLPYEMSSAVESAPVARRSGGLAASSISRGPKENVFCFEIEVDNLNRAWIHGVVEQETGEKGTETYKPMKRAFEVYSSEGILLQRLDIPITGFDIAYTFKPFFRIFDDKLYIIDTMESMAVYEYNIIN